MSEQPSGSLSFESLRFQALTATVRGLSHLICRIQADELSAVPTRGPLILVTNHVNFLDAPVLYTQLQPRPVTGFAKLETWDNPVIGGLFSIGGAIPLKRGSADVQAIQRGLEALRQGKIVTITPEGTRSGDGCLRRGHPGVVTLALHSGAPLLPVAFYGLEMYRRNLRRLKRTDFYFRVGRQFSIDTGGKATNQALRRAITDEIMCQLALLLPPEYRGAYAGCLSRQTTNYIRFDTN